ncbi:MAG: helix-turn-helix transcriptional regulator [bacterium]|nr:helix-turn-helix transcriptional regulator [bacterium]
MSHTLQKQIGERIKKLRKEKGLTQDDMVKYLHCGRSNYSKIESGQVMAGGALLAALHLTFNTSLDWLITGKGSMFYQAAAIDFGDYADDVRELLNDMARSKATKHSVLSHYYTYRTKIRFSLLEPEEEARKVDEYE